MKVTIPVNLGDVKESKPVPAGKYDLTIASVEDTKSQAGKPQLRVSIGIDGHDDAPNLTHFVSLPSPGDEKSQAKALFLKRFLAMFSIPHEDMAFDTDDFPGASAKGAEVSLSEPDDNGRVYNRLIVPYMQEDGANGGRKAPPPPKR